MADETPPVESGAPVPEAPPVEAPPAPVETPPEPPKPEVDLATKIIAAAIRYQQRLIACEYGLVNPVSLGNPNFQYASALSVEDKSYLAERIVADFTQLRSSLHETMTAEIATLIGR